MAQKVGRQNNIKSVNRSALKLEDKVLRLKRKGAPPARIATLEKKLKIKKGGNQQVGKPNIRALRYQTHNDASHAS